MRNREISWWSVCKSCSFGPESFWMVEQEGGVLFLSKRPRDDVRRPNRAEFKDDWRKILAI